MDIDTLQGLKKSPLFKDVDESEIIDLMHTIRFGSFIIAKAIFMPMRAQCANMQTLSSAVSWWHILQDHLVVSFGWLPIKLASCWLPLSFLLRTTITP